MSQWGSKALGDDGLSAIEILRYYYGDDMYINEAETISGIPASYPGYELTIGASGQKVRQMQEQLNVIAGDYPLIPKIRVDGIYGEKARAAEAMSAAAPPMSSASSCAESVTASGRAARMLSSSLTLPP